MGDDSKWEKQLRYESSLEGTSCITLSRDRAGSYRVYRDPIPVERTGNNLKRQVFRYSVVNVKNLVAGMGCKLGEGLAIKMAQGPNPALGRLGCTSHRVMIANKLI